MVGELSFQLTGSDATGWLELIQSCPDADSLITPIPGWRNWEIKPAPNGNVWEIRPTSDTRDLR